MARSSRISEQIQLPAGFINELREHQARASIGVSTVRNQGTGTARITREFLAHELDLSGMRAHSERAYLRRLDSATDDLRRRLRGKARTFGLARIVINIYMRDCVYSRYLHAAHRLDPIEPFLELPLDGIVGRRLWKVPRDSGYAPGLPRWTSIRALTREDSDRYQAFARKWAATRQLARVHLDVGLWGARKG
jgi:hypothetical protein